MSSPEFANPLVYAQFSMRGGWKNTLVVAGCYGVLISAAIAAMAENSLKPATTLSGWVTGLLVIQGLTLLIYGSNRVGTAVRSDVKSGIMESHRLMPTSPFSVVAGYIFGAPVQALFMAGVTFIVGTVVCPAAHIDVQRWLVANFMLLAFALMLWTLTFQTSISAKGGVAILFFGIFVGSYSTGLGTTLPAASVLLCPLIARSVFMMRDTFSDLSFAYGCALAGQALVAAVCLVAAVRRYRRPEMPAFNLTLGLALLAVAVGLSLDGMLHDDEFRLSFTHTSLSTELIASAVLCMAVSLIPLAATARRRAQYQRDGEAFVGRRPRVPVLLAVVLCTTLIAALFTVGARVTDDAATSAVITNYQVPTVHTPGSAQRRPTVVLPTAAAVVDHVSYRIQLSVVEIFLALTGVTAVFRWVYLTTDRAWFVVTIWLVLFWVLPLVADTLHRSVQDRSYDPMGPIASPSPIGTLIIAWTGDPGTARLGVIFSGAVVLFPLTLIYTVQQRQRRRARLTSTPQSAAI